MYNKPKNRSNIAASILLNGDMLQQVKEASENDYLGSADEELSKYLDSIDGKIAQFQNRLQELAATTIDSSWLKGIIDLGTNAITVINNLAESFGGLNMILGSIAGVVLQTKGLGLFKYDRKEGMMLNQGITDFFKPDEVQVSASVKKVFDQIETAKSQLSSQDDIVPWDKFIADTKLADKSIIDFLNDTKYSEKTLENYKLYLTEATRATSGFGRVLGGLKSVGVNVLSAISNAALSMIASFVVSKVIEGIVYIFTWQDKLIQKGKEAQQTIKDTYAEIKKGQESIKTLTTDIGIKVPEDATVKEDLEKIAEEYTRLRAGVSNVTNENLTLSTDDYEHYLEICNKLAEQYPNLIKQHDAQGNAILDISSASDECAKKLKEVYDNALLVANVDIGKNLMDAFKGLNEEIEKYSENNDFLSNSVENAQNEAKALEEIVNKQYGINNNILNFDVKEHSSLVEDIVRQAANQYAQETKQPLLLDFANIGEGLQVTLADGSFNFPEQFLQILDEEIESKLTSESERYQAEAQDKLIELKSNQSYIEDQRRIVEELAENYIQTRPSFNDMNSAVQDAVLSNFKIDFDKLNDKNGDYKGDIKLYLYNEVITPLSQINEEAQEELAKIFTLDSSSLSLDSYTDKINKILEEAAQKGGVDVDFLKKVLPIEQLTSEYEEQEEYLKGIFTSEEDQALIDKLSMPELLQAAELVKQHGNKWAKVFQTVIDTLERQKAQLKNDTTFSSLLADTESETGIQKIVDNFQSLNTEIQGFIDSINNGEKVNMADIIQAHPEELAEYGDSLDHLLEGLIKFQTDEADEFGSLLRNKITEGLGKDPDEEQVKYAEAFIMNLLSSMDINNISLDDLVKKISDAIFNNTMKTTSYSPGLPEYARKTADELSNQIADYIENTGEDQEITQEAVLRLSADTESATWDFETWKEKIESMVVLIRLGWDQKELENLQNEAATLTNEKTAITNRISNLENRGEYASDEDYETLIKINQVLKDNNAEQIAYKQSQLDGMEVNEQNRQVYNSLKSEIIDLTQQQETLNTETSEWLLMLNGGKELAKLQSAMEKLKEEETAIGDEKGFLGFNNERGYSLDLEMRELENQVAQAENLKAQNKELEKQQKTIGITKKKYDELNSAINQNNSQIISLSQNVEQHVIALTNYAGVVAGSMKDAVSQAINANTSAEGVDRESMQKLISQFRELQNVSNIDVSKIFYSSSKGIKLNIRALDSLLDLQNKIYGRSLLTGVTHYTEALKNQVNAINLVGQAERNEAKQTLDGYRSKLRAMNKVLTGYNTLYKATKEMTSQYAKWQEAVNSENPGDKYDEFASKAGEYEKMRDEGKVGTDEFKAWTGFFNRYGLGSVNMYDKEYSKMVRYMYPGPEGAVNFADDMINAGFGHRNEAGGYVFDVVNLEEVSKALGIHVELVEMLIGKAKDYGAEIEIVNSAIDGQVRIEEKSVEMVDEMWRKAKEMTESADESYILESNSIIVGLENDIKNISKAIDMYSRAEDLTEDEYMTAINFFKEATVEAERLKGMGAEEAVAQIAEEMEEASKKFGIKIEANDRGYYDMVDTSIDEARERITEYGKAMAEYLPDWVDIVDNYHEQINSADYKGVLVTPYKKAYDELVKEAENQKIPINWDLDYNDENTTIQQIVEHLEDLKKIQIDPEVNPALAETLDNLMNIDNNEIKLRTLIDISEQTGNKITLQDLANMTEEEVYDVMIKAGTSASSEDAQAILALAKNKVGEIPITMKIDEDQLNEILGRLGPKVSDAINDAGKEAENEIEPIDIPLDMKESLDYLKSQINEMKDNNFVNDISDVFNGNLETTFGNIDMNVRETLTWTEETIEKYHDMAEELGVSVGDTSTVLGSWNQFKVRDQSGKTLGLSVAYTPLLQTGTGTPEILDEETISQYIRELMQKATQVVFDENGSHLEIDQAFMLDLDKEGLQVGNTFVQGIIAAMDTNLDEGNIADKVSQMMHFSGDYGSIQLTIDGIKEFAEQLGISVELVETLIERYTEFGELPEGFNLDAPKKALRNLKSDLDDAEIINPDDFTYVIDPEENITIDPKKKLGIDDFVDIDPEILTGKFEEAFKELKSQVSSWKEELNNVINSSTITGNNIEPIGVFKRKEGTSVSYDGPIGPKQAVAYDEPIGPVREQETKQVSATFTLSQDNVKDIFDQLQTYCDSHGVELKILGENKDAKDKIDEAFEYKEGNTYTVILEGKPGESFDQAQKKAESLVGLMSGDYTLEFGASEESLTNLEELNTEIDNAQENAEEETEININTDESSGNINNLDNQINAAQQNAQDGVAMVVTISGDDTTQLVNAVTEINKNKDITININGIDMGLKEAIEYIEAKDGEDISINLIASDIDAKETLRTFCEETVPGKFPKVKVGGNIDPLNASVKGGVEQINAAPAAMQDVDANMDPFENTLQGYRNNIQPIKIPVLYDEPIGPVQQVQQNPYQAQSAYDNSLRNSIVYYKAHGTLNAYAKGTDVKNGRLIKDEDALVNELGQEAIIRGNQLHMIPGGMHVEHLRKGDIILNHKQVEALQETGKAPGHGKIVGGESAFSHGTCLTDDDKLKLALALGTVYDGMSARVSLSPYGSVGGGTWGGVNTANYDTLQDRFGMIDDTVDDLDDFDDALNDLLDDIADLDEHIQPSFQTIDLVQRRLQYFSNATKKVADQITEFIDSATKKNLLTQEISALQNEIYANSRAAATYANEALNRATDYKYYAVDKAAERAIKEAIIGQKSQLLYVDRENDKETYRSINNNIRALERDLNQVQNTPVEYHINLAAEIPLDLLRNGEFSLMDIDTSTEHGQAVYDAAQQYMNLIDSANNASSQIQQLSNQLRQLYSEMIQLPFDDLDKALGKLESTMSTISSFMNTMQSGEAGIRRLEQVLVGLFGQDEARKMVNTQGKSYEVIIQELEENMLNRADVAVRNKQTYDESGRVLEDLKNQRAQADAELAGIKWIVGSLPMNYEDRLAYEQGNFLDASHFAEGELIAEYNTLLSKAKELGTAVPEAEEKMAEQLEKTKQSAADAAQAVIDYMEQGLQAINNFYSTAANYYASFADNIAANRDYMIKWKKYIGNDEKIITKYRAEMVKLNNEISQNKKNIAAQEDFVQRQLSMGRLQIGDTEYKKYMTDIENMKTQNVELKSKVMDLYDALANVPNEVVAEKLKKISDAYRDVSEAMSSGNMDSQSNIRAYERIVNATQNNTGVRSNQTLQYLNGKTYQVQNRLLEQDTIKKQEEYIAAAQGEYQAYAEYRKQLANGNDEKIKAAWEALQTARETTTEKLNAVAQAEVENVTKAMQNIDNFYKKIISYQDSINQRNETIRNFILEVGNLAGRESKLIDTYIETGKALGKETNLLKQDIEELQTELDNGVKNGWIVEGDERWMELNQMIIGNKNQLEENRLSQLKNYKTMLEIPSKIAEEKINDITNAYLALNAAMSANINTSHSALELLGRVSNISGVGGLEVDTRTPYRAQNQLIAQNIKQEQEKLEPMMLARAKLQAEYDELLWQKAESESGGLFSSIDVQVWDEQIDAAKEKLIQADKEIAEQQDKTIKLQTEGAQEMIRNIENTFQVYLNHQDQLRQGYESIRNYTLEIGSYVEDGVKVANTFKDEIYSYSRDADRLREEIADMKAQLEEGIASGSISSFDAITIKDNISKRQNELRQVGINQQNALESLLSIPSKITEENIEKIETAYAEMNAAIDAGVKDTQAKQRAYGKLKFAAGLDNSELFVSREHVPTFVEQNEALRSRLDQSRKELESRYKEMLATKETLDYIKRRPETDQSIIKKAQQAYENAYKGFVKIQADVASLEVDTAVKAIENIDFYYKSLNEFYGTISDQLEKVRNYIMETSSYIKSSGEFMRSYQDQIIELNKQYVILARDRDMVQAQLDQAMTEGVFTVDDEEYRDAMNKIRGIENEMLAVRSSQQKLFNDLVNIPNETATEKIEQIANAYMHVSAAISAGITESKAMQRNYSNINKALVQNNPYVAPVAGLDFDQGPTYVGQNKAMLYELQQGQAELATYNQAVYETGKNFETIRNDADATEGEIKAALEAYETALKNFTDKETEIAAKEVNTAKQIVQNIGTYYDSLQQYNQDLAASYEKVRDVLEELGRGLDVNGNLIADNEQIIKSYRIQLASLQTAQNRIAESIIMQETQLQMLKDVLQEDTEEYREVQSTLNNLRQTYMDLTINIDQLQDEMRQELYLKPIEEAIEKIQRLQNALSSLNGMISNEAKLTEDGEYTQLGKVSLALDTAQYTQSLKELEDAQEYYATIQERYLNDASYSGEEYMTDMQKASEQIIEAMQNVNSAREAMLNAEKSRMETEIKYVQKLIQAQKEELAKKKELADYDKQMKKKNNSIRQLENEIAALEGLVDAESLSKKARLEAQLSEAKEDRQDTITSHVYDLRNENLDNLSQHLDELYEKFAKDLVMNISSTIEAVDKTADNLALCIGETNAALDTWLKTFQPGLNAAMILGVDKLTTDNANSVPNRTLIENMANSMVNYADNLSPQEFDRIHAENNQIIQNSQYLGTLTSDGTNKVTSAVGNISDGFNNSVASGAQTISNGVNNSLTNVGNNIVGGVGGINNSVQNASSNIAGSVNNVNNSVQNTGNNISNSVDNINGSISNADNNITNSVNGINSAVQNAADSTNSAISSSGNNLANSISNGTNTVNNSLGNISGGFNESVLSGSQAIFNGVNSSLFNATNSISDSILTSSENESQIIYNGTGKISSNIGDVNSSLQNVSNNTNNAILSNGEILNSSILNGTSVVNNSLGNISNGFDASVMDGADKINTSIYSGINGINGSLSSSANSINTNIYNASGDISSSYANGTKTLQSGLAIIDGSIQSEIAGILGYKQDLSGIREDNSAMLTQEEKLRQQQERYQAEQAAREISGMQNFVARNQLVLDYILSSGRDITSVMDTGTGRINTTLNQNIESIDSILSDTRNGFGTNITDMGQQFNNSINQLIESDKELNNSINSSISQGTQNIGTSISGGVSNINTSINQGTQNIGSSISDGAANINSSISQEAQSIGLSISGGTSNITGQLLNGATILDGAISGGISNITGELINQALGVEQSLSFISHDVANGSGLIDQSIMASTGVLNNSIGGISSGFESSVNNGANSIGGHLDQSSNSINGRIDSQTGELSNSIDGVSSGFNTSVSNGANFIGGFVNSGASTVAGQIGSSELSLADKLSLINSSLTTPGQGTLIGSINDSKTQIDGSLLTGFGGVSTSIGGINTALTDSNGNLANAINNPSGIISEFGKIFTNLTSTGDGTIIGTGQAIDTSLTNGFSTVSTIAANMIDGVKLDKVTTGLEEYIGGEGFLEEITGGLGNIEETDKSKLTALIGDKNKSVSDLYNQLETVSPKNDVQTIGDSVGRIETAISEYNNEDEDPKEDPYKEIFKAIEGSMGTIDHNIEKVSKEIEKIPTALDGKSTGIPNLTTAITNLKTSVDNQITAYNATGSTIPNEAPTVKNNTPTYNPPSTKDVVSNANLKSNGNSNNGSTGTGTNSSAADVRLLDSPDMVNVDILRKILAQRGNYALFNMSSKQALLNTLQNRQALPVSSKMDSKFKSLAELWNRYRLGLDESTIKNIIKQYESGSVSNSNSNIISPSTNTSGTNISQLLPSAGSVKLTDTTSAKTSTATSNAVKATSVSTSTATQKQTTAQVDTMVSKFIKYIIIKNDSDMKKYFQNITTVQKALDAIYNGQELKKSGTTVLSGFSEYNNNRTKYTKAERKKLINDEIDKNKSSIKASVKKYAKGTFSASSGLAQVFEEGPEIITTKKGTFVPFTGGEGVIPTDLTKNLVKMALLMKDGNFELKMPDMSNYKVPELKQDVTSNNEIHIGSLITINGNADENTVDQIKEIAQSLVKNRQFQENVTKFVSARQTADGVMAGKRKAIR